MPVQPLIGHRSLRPFPVRHPDHGKPSDGHHGPSVVIGSVVGLKERLDVARALKLIVLREDASPARRRGNLWVLTVPIGATRFRWPIHAALMPENEKKNSLIVKVTIDELTAVRLLSRKPNTQSMASFCAMLIEYGLKTWDERMGDQ